MKTDAESNYSNEKIKKYYNMILDKYADKAGVL